MKKRRVDHLVDVELLEIVGISCHLDGLGVKPKDETVKEKPYQSQEYSAYHISDRGGEVCFNFFFAYGPGVLH